jgi:adenylate cyclase
LIQTNFLGFKSVGRSFSLDIFTQITPHEDHQDIASEFVFVDIDEKSLNDLGQWPWPRIIFADVIEKIIDAEPAVLGIDILLSETDRFNPNAIESIAKESDINIADFFTNGDEALAGILYDAPVVLATAFGDETKKQTEKRQPNSGQR